MRGRVMSAYSIMFFGMAPLGSLFAGSIADIIGAPTTVLIGALISLAGAICFRAFLGRIERAISGEMAWLCAPEAESPSDSPP